MAGLQELVINNDGSVLLIDGASGELLFEEPTVSGDPYLSPAGDFSTLVQLPDGTFQRTMKDQTTYNFNLDNKLESMADRNGNTTTYMYNGQDLLEKMIDPVGLETTFAYNANNKVSSITDPSNRVTTFGYDGDGNLITITDPDNTQRIFGYDSNHHLTSETDKRNNQEEAYYDFAGRADYAITKDGETIDVDPFQSRVLAAPSQTTDALNAPVASSLSNIEAIYTDANGHSTAVTLDRRGQLVSASDQQGFMPSEQRDEATNLISEQVDARGNITEYGYDSNGNVTSIVDTPGSRVSFGDVNTFTVAEGPQAFGAGDFNEDGITDIVTINQVNGNSVTLLLGTAGGGFTNRVDIPVSSNIGSSSFYEGLPIADLNGDNHLDLVIGDGSELDIYFGDGNGNFSSIPSSSIPFSIPGGAFGASPLELNDLDKDGDIDVIARVGFFVEGVTNGVFLALNQGNGSFSSPVSIAGSGSFGLADLNNDGFADAVSVESANALSVSLNNGAGGFNSPISTSSGVDLSGGIGIEAGDFNGDNNLDLATSSGSNAIAILLGDGAGSFTNISSFNFGSPISQLQVGDIDQDGISDIVAARDFQSTVAVLLGTGSGTFESAIDLPFDFYGQARTFLGNLNGDSILDIATLNLDNDPNTPNPENINVSVLLTNSVNPLFGDSSIVTGTETYTFDPTFSQQTSFTDELGRQTLYDIDPMNGNVRSETRVVGTEGGGDDVIITYTYTSQGQIDTMTDPLGRVTDNDYDSFGNLTKITYAKGTPDEAFQEFEYDAAGNQTAMIDENGNRTEYEYDELNRTERMIEADPDGEGVQISPVTSYTYDEHGNQRTITDPLGRVTTYEYNEMDRLIKMTEADPDGAGPLASPVTTYTYDEHSNRISMTDPLNRLTEYRYDDRDRLMETIYPDDAVEQQIYDADDNAIASIDGNGHRTEMVYDLRDRLVLQKDPLGNETRYEYDEADQLVAIIDANGNRTDFGYDDLGRQTSITNSLNHIYITNYDKVGNIVSEIDPLAQTTIYNYDNRDRQIQFVDPINGITTTTYDGVGNITSITDPENNTTSYVYDNLNRLIMETNELSLSRTHVYDPIGNRIRTTDRNNRTREFSYDDLNRMTAEIWLDDSAVPIRTTTFTYDADDQLTSISDPDSTYTYTYDQRGRLETTNNAGTAGSPTVVMNYDYDDASNLIRGEDFINGVSSGITSYIYDDANRLTHLHRMVMA
jgi:YD repeat-containing protein